MKNESDNPGYIDPNQVYTIAGVAKILGVSAKLLRADFVTSGIWASAQINRSVRLIPGHVIARWVEENMTGGA